MILMEFLLAPTVPSEPRPQNLQEVVPFGVVLGFSFIFRESFVTSSSMPTVKRFFGLGAETVSAGVNRDIGKFRVAESGNDIKIQRLAQ